MLSSASLGNGDVEAFKMVPITVEGDLGRRSHTSAVDEVITAALEQFLRIEHLTLTFHRGWPKLEEASSIFSGAASLLRTFQIVSDDLQIMLPETIFSGPSGAPLLRRVDLYRCDFNWRSEFLRSLTHFTVGRVPTGCRLSVSELITNLRNIPQLESIRLFSVLVAPKHPELNASSGPSSSTHLPFIARIHLEDNLMSCFAFFTTFIYLNTAIVSIKCFCLGHHTDDVVLPVRDLITTINAKNIVPITSLYVDNSYPGTFRGQDSQGIGRVFVEFPGISSILCQFSGITWDVLTLHYLKSLQVVGIKISESVGSAFSAS